jgi:hypothetical protein
MSAKRRTCPSLRKAAREALPALEIPAVQPGSIMAATGMPKAFMHPGPICSTQTMHHDGAVYALLPDEDNSFQNDPITGDWVRSRCQSCRRPTKPESPPAGYRTPRSKRPPSGCRARLRPGGCPQLGFP